MVREWALFGLGRGQVDPVDTPEARAAFLENVEHPDEDVRAEAIQALGLLGDVEMLVRTFGYEDVSIDAVECAAQLGDQRLHEPLVRLKARGWAQVDGAEHAKRLSEVLTNAIEATRPPTGRVA